MGVCREGWDVGDDGVGSTDGVEGTGGSAYGEFVFGVELDVPEDAEGASGAGVSSGDG